MKKSILFMALGLAMTTLGSCAKEAVTDDQKDSSINYLDYNDIKSEEYIPTVNSELTKVEIKLPDGFYHKSEFNYTECILAVNRDGIYGLYNYIKRSWVVNPCLKVSYDSSKEAYGIQHVAGSKNKTDIPLFEVTINERFIIVDNNGNVYYDGKRPENLEYKVLFNNEETRLFDKYCIKFHNLYKEETKFRIDKNGKSEKYSFTLKDLYDTTLRENKINLTEYGLEGKFLLNNPNGSLSVTDASGKTERVLNVVPDDGSIDMMVLVGSKIIYQIVYDVNDFSANYSYYDPEDEDKVCVETYSVDMTTGESSKIDFNYLIDDYEIWHDENGLKKVFCAEVYEFRDKEFYTNDKAYIFDENLNLLQDVSNNPLFYSTKIDDDYYFNFRENTIFDKELNEVGYINNDNIVDFLPDHKFFVTEDDSGEFVGITDIRGNVIEPTIYNDFFYLEGGEIYCLKRENELLVKNAKTHETIERINGVMEIEKTRSTLIFGSFERIGVIDANGKITALNGEIDFMELAPTIGESIILNYSDFEEGKTATIYTSVETSNATITPVGEAYVKETHNGNDRYDCLTLELGEKTIPADTTNTYVYMNFEPEKTGYYKFENAIPTNVQIRYKNNIGNVSSYFINGFDGQILFEAGKEYVIIFDRSTEITIKLTLIDEVTEFGTADEEITAEEASLHYVARLYTAEKTGTHSLVKEGIPSPVVITTDSSGYTYTADVLSDSTGDYHYLYEGKTYYVIYKITTAAYTIKVPSFYETHSFDFKVDYNDSKWNYNVDTNEYTIKEPTYNTNFNLNILTTRKGILTFGIKVSLSGNSNVRVSNPFGPDADLEGNDYQYFEMTLTEDMTGFNIVVHIGQISNVCENNVRIINPTFIAL